MIWERVFDEGILERLHREAHTIKGLTSFLEVDEISRLASRLTDTLKSLWDGEEEVPQTIMDALTTDATTLSGLLASMAPPPVDVQVDVIPDGGPDLPVPPVSELDQTAIISADEWAQDGDTCALRVRAANASAMISALSEAIGEVFSGFGIEPTTSGGVDVGEFTATTRDLTVIVDPKADLGGAVVFEFDSTAAGALACEIAASTVGETATPPAGEDAEFVAGVLAEMVNFTMFAVFKNLGLPPKFAAPRFVRGRGVSLSPTPRAKRGLTVSTGLGEFEVAFVPGAVQLLPDEATGTQARPRDYRRKVVVADDSAVMRKTIERALQQGGYEVVAHASNGREAIEEFRRHRPDLLVLDICMPVMGGLDALKIIHAEDPAARVLISSSIADREVVGRGFQSGAMGYITKPFKPDMLTEIIDSLLNARGTAEASSKGSGADGPGLPNLGIYRVGKLLGEGGMAMVYEGYDPGLGRTVALKVIKGEFAGDVDLVVRFLEEARAVAKINHPNVVGIYFAGSDRGKHFFAMALLTGPDLKSLVEDKGPLPVKEALTYIRQGALGLAAAKRQGLIHCDVKPSNLLLNCTGSLEVTDFGISRGVGERDEPGNDDIIGTPGFMAPEQVVQLPIDHKTDIYSLGATLHFLLTGQPPYTGKEPVEVALRHVNDPVPTLPKQSLRLNRLLEKMMAKAPRDRFSDYDPLLRQIGRLL